jgi:hypothetical protein
MSNTLKKIILEKRQSGQELTKKDFGNSCLSNYKSGEYQYPEAGNLIAPWVAINFVDAGNRSDIKGTAAITVSNHSSESTDPKHCAVIKSFNFGHSDGISAKVIIQDTQGGNFEVFMRHLISDWTCTGRLRSTASLSAIFQFGWVKSGCVEPVPEARSPVYYGVCYSVDASFSEGKINFEIDIRDLTSYMFEGSATWSDGGSGQQSMYFLHALKTLLSDSNASGSPAVSQISFKLNDTKFLNINSKTNLDAKNEDLPELFNAGTTDEEKRLGIKGPWQSHGKNKIEIAKKWSVTSPSINNKPWVITYNPEVKGGEILFQEELTITDCNNKNDEYFDKNSLGTYIVNGGNHSRVLEFNPTIKWNFAQLVGTTAGAMGELSTNSFDTEGGKNPGSTCVPADENKGAGLITSTSTPDIILDAEGSDGVKADALNESIHQSVNVANFSSIEADLVIIGDPVFCPPIFCKSKYISIIVINPFHIESSTFNKTSIKDWYISLPPCNQVLSSKAWTVQSVSHQIDSGKYTTTIGVKLVAPGIEISKNQKLGGWSNGWKPPSCQS